MQGSVFITHAQGWACSNSVLWVVERDIIEGENGQKVSKHTNTLRVSGAFNGKGLLEVGLQIDCVFKIDDEDKKQSFIGEISAMTKDTVLIILKAKTERTEQILKQIKEEI